MEFYGGSTNRVGTLHFFEPTLLQLGCADRPTNLLGQSLGQHIGLACALLDLNDSEQSCDRQLTLSTLLDNSTFFSDRCGVLFCHQAHTKVASRSGRSHAVHGGRLVAYLVAKSRPTFTGACGCCGRGCGRIGSSGRHPLSTRLQAVSNRVRLSPNARLIGHTRHGGE